MTPISPLAISMSLAVLYGIVEPLRVLNSGDTFVGLVDHSTRIPRATFLTALAAFFIALGSHFGATLIGQQRRSASNRVATNAMRIALAGALAVASFVAATRGVSGRAIIPELAGPGAGNGYLALMPQVAFGLALCLWYVDERTNRRWLPTLGLVISFLILFASGTRYPVIVGGGAILACRYLKRTGTLPTFRQLPAVVLLGFLVLGWIGVARSQTAFGLDRNQTEAATSSSQIFVPQAALHYYVEHHGFELGATYSYTLVQIIPRAVWPSKPTNPIDGVVSELFPGSGIAFPIWGEWYLNFGWLGVPVLGFAFGAISTALWTRWCRRRSGPSLSDPIAILASLLLINAVSRGYFVQAVYIYAAFLFLPIALSRKLLNMNTVRSDNHRKRSQVLPRPLPLGIDDD